MNGEREQLEVTPQFDDRVRLSDGREIAIYLHDGIACVAELKDGRVAVASFSAWSTANQGGRALRSAIRAAEGPGTLARLAAALASRMASLSRRLAARHAVPGSAAARSGPDRPVSGPA
jgi:hypothetical protein